jgi:hypothetical protein
MVAGLREKHSREELTNPCAYLSTLIKAAHAPGGLLIEDYALESLKAWYREQTGSR